MVKLLVDQNYQVALAESFRNADYDSVHTSEIGLNGAKDPEILEYARSEKRIIITKDKGDFTRTLANQHATEPSVILVRPPLSDELIDSQLEILLMILETHAETLEKGAIIKVASKDKIRIRTLPVE